MGATPEPEKNPADYASFGFSKVPRFDGRYQVTIQYRRVTANILWADDDAGNKELDNLVGAMEELIVNVRREQEVYRHSLSLDREIAELLGDDEEEEE